MPVQNFRPLPMRITEKQYDRLKAAREFDNLAIQEHVRRALDFYLDAFEAKQVPISAAAPAAAAAAPAQTSSVTPADPNPTSHAGKTGRKLVYR